MISQRARIPRLQPELLDCLLHCSDDWQKVLELSPNFSEMASMQNTLLSEAARFADGVLSPLNHTMDVVGAKLVNGRVVTADGHKEAWKQFVEAGWTLLGKPELYGGQEAPLALWAAIQGIFDRSSPAFGMLPVPQISAVKLISHWGDEKTRKDWLPNLVSGIWGATICISEPDAGSDVRRMRTKAEKQLDGSWRITGEKCWISYGDHDLAEKIGHCLLAYSYDEKGVPGISLFLVPNRLEVNQHGQASGNGVTIQRVEEKMGLHGSPTCVISFEKSEAILLGKTGQGLSQMFVMIANMRLSVGVMGTAIASAAYDTALNYTFERKQGGPADKPPVAIYQHVDVKRMLMEMAANTNLMRGLVFSIANHTDLSLSSSDEAQREQSHLFTQFLLPVVKTLGADIGFQVASTAIQVLGGAGYTGEWPVEQALRDSRVLSIFEGTSGIQALDLLKRRLKGRDQGKGLKVFLDKAYELTGALPSNLANNYQSGLDLLKITAQKLASLDDEDGEAGADAFLRLTGRAALGWIAARLIAAGDIPAQLRSQSEFYLHEMAIKCRALSDLALLGRARLGQTEAQ